MDKNNARRNLRVYVDDVLEAQPKLSRQQLVILSAYIARTKKIKAVDALIALQDGTIPKEEIEQLIDFLNERTPLWT